jgi:hypothetical protein
MEDRSLLATFTVFNTADAGPGSLRQAILDSNSSTDPSSVIDFAIAGAGVKTIELDSALPALTSPVLIDGSSERGYSGTPLVALGGSLGNTSVALVIATPTATIRAVGGVSSVGFLATDDGLLTARVSGQPASARLLLLDAQGHLLVQSDGVSPTVPDDLIEQHVTTGTYLIDVQTPTGAATWSLSTSLIPASNPGQTVPLPPLASSITPLIAVGDFNHDGIADLVTPGGVSLAVGDGTFEPPAAGASLIDPSSNAYAGGIAVGDFNDDGNLDVALLLSFPDFSADLAIYLGKGDGTFQSPTLIALPDRSGPDAIVAGDFLGKGQVDLAVAEGSADAVAVFAGAGDGTFQAFPAVAVGGSPYAMAAGDFENDGRNDLAVVLNGVASITILSNQGDGLFQSLAPISLPGLDPTPSGIVAGKFGTPNVDLAVTEDGDIENLVDVFDGHGDGTFSYAASYGVGQNPSQIVAGDFGNGQTDLAIANASGEDDDVSILLGKGDGTFQPAVAYAVGTDPYEIVTGDFSSDGRLDLATVNSTNDISVLLGKGDGIFESGIGNAVGENPQGAAVGDFTGNGNLSVAVVNGGSNSITLLPGNGDGTFQAPVTVALPSGSEPTSVVAGDFNNDGRMDLAVVDFALSTVSILLGNGNGTFITLAPIPIGDGPYTIAEGDFTGNGIIDLAVTDPYAGTVTILLGNGDGTFRPQPPIALAPGSFPTAIVEGQFGGGHPDLAVGDGYGATLQLLLGNGDGTFQLQAPLSVSASIASLVLTTGDFRNNGRTDIAASVTSYLTGTSSLVVLLSNGDGTFQQPWMLPIAVTPVAILAGNFTNDGVVDIATADSLGELDGGIDAYSVFIGNGDGTFQAPTPFGLPGTGNSAAIVSGDFTGNRVTDLALVRYGPNNVQMLLGNGDGTFADPSTEKLTRDETPLVADFNGDGVPDVAIVDASGDILYREGESDNPGLFAAPIIVNPGDPARSIAVVKTRLGLVLASVDALDDAVSLFLWSNGAFVQIGSIATGYLPAQILSADLYGDGRDDLVVRDAGSDALTIIDSGFFIGPPGPGPEPEQLFAPPLSIAIGPGVSDVQAIDTTGSGKLDLVITNELTGQLSVLVNEGNGVFASAHVYRAGGGASLAGDTGSVTDVTSLDQTAGVAAATLTAGGPVGLVTIDPGSNTLAVLPGLGDGRFANAVAVETPSPAEIVQSADLSGDGISDLAVLSAAGLSIYLGNGRGGFSAPMTYDAGADPTGLSIADLTGEGRLDILVGDAQGDVLILEGNGDGTFRPYEPVKSAIALAVADLTGNGVPDFVFANQSLSRVSVVYGTAGPGASSPEVVADQSSGLLAPGAVKLVDMNGDGIPDLIVANGGGNNVLVYPGLGDGQFGPPVGGTAGFAVGTDPTGLTIANLNGQPDVLVADTGSNDVSVLLGQGKGTAWTLIPGPRIQTEAGPVATVVGNLLGNGQTDLAVANSQANTVQVFPAAGNGFFNDQPAAVKTYNVGQSPADIFFGNFGGQGNGVATINPGSNNGTLISNLASPNPLTQTFDTGGVSPITGFAGDFSGNGYTDLVVGNYGDGRVSLILGSATGLTLSQTLSSPAAPNPTDLSFGALAGGFLNFYASTAGREAAIDLAFNLGSDIGTGGDIGARLSAPLPGFSAVPDANIFQIAQLGSSSGAGFELIATLVTLTVVPGNLESELGSTGASVALLASFGPGGSTGLGQSLRTENNPNAAAADPDPKAAQSQGIASAANAAVDRLAPWAQFAIGLDDAWRDLRSRMIDGARGDSAQGRGESGMAPATPKSAAPVLPSVVSPPAEVHEPPDTETSTERAEPSVSGASANRAELPGSSGEHSGRGETAERTDPSDDASKTFGAVAVDAVIERLSGPLGSLWPFVALGAANDEEPIPVPAQLALAAVSASAAISLTWRRAIFRQADFPEASDVGRRASTPPGLSTAFRRCRP